MPTDLTLPEPPTQARGSRVDPAAPDSLDRQRLKGAASDLVEILVSDAKKAIVTAPVDRAPLSVVAMLMGVEPARLDVLADMARTAELPGRTELDRIVLHAEATLSFVAILMPPKASVPAHDHHSACISLIVRGLLTEVNFWQRPDGRWEFQRTVLGPREPSISCPRDIHAIMNAHTAGCLCLNVYFHDYLRYGGMRRLYRDVPAESFQC